MGGGRWSYVRGGVMVVPGIRSNETLRLDGIPTPTHINASSHDGVSPRAHTFRRPHPSPHLGSTHTHAHSLVRDVYGMWYVWYGSRAGLGPAQGRVWWGHVAAFRQLAVTWQVVPCARSATANHPLPQEVQRKIK